MNSLKDPFPLDFLPTIRLVRNIADVRRCRKRMLNGGTWPTPTLLPLPPEARLNPVEGGNRPTVPGPTFSGHCRPLDRVMRQPEGDQFGAQSRGGRTPSFQKTLEVSPGEVPPRIVFLTAPILEARTSAAAKWIAIGERIELTRKLPTARRGTSAKPARGGPTSGGQL